MSFKRSRATYEADTSHASFAVFGTPLPDEAESRDDGSFVPIWKQEVRDERGRKRLHGAFTGGFSAGYFNTVGSKEGWTPSTFVSSRNSRKKDDGKTARQRAEDFMDEEDLADAAEAQKLETSGDFAGLGSGTQGLSRAGGLAGLFRASGDTMGHKLLRRMGWKEGQGIGPKVRRSARLDMGKPIHEQGETHLLAPDDAPMVQVFRKTDKKGLGYEGEGRLSTLRRDKHGLQDGSDEEEPIQKDLPFSLTAKVKDKPKRGGIGMGILNDNGSDEEDPYEIGPKIKYNKVIGGDKKKKTRKPAPVGNPSLKSTPVFLSKTARAGGNLRRCHDGRLPLDGFVLAQVTEDFAALLSKYAPPPIPPGWKSKMNPAEPGETGSSGSADTAQRAKLDPKARAAILGEGMLPGKSVFDYLSASARDKLASASGRSDLPQGRGEIPEGYAMSEEERHKMLWERVPKIDPGTASAALARASGGPYADDDEKRQRYRTYLETLTKSDPLPIRKSVGVREEDFLKEMNEFYNCARIFKPMTGFMASRFTTSKAISSAVSGSSDAELLSKPETRVADPAEEAAKMGMYGHMTRSVADFYPTRLLCKRFNVKAPAHSQPDDQGSSAQSAAKRDEWSTSFSASSQNGQGIRESQTKSIEAAPPPEPVPPSPKVEAEVVPNQNEAVEGMAANEDVLRAIFGDSDNVGPSASWEPAEDWVQNDHKRKRGDIDDPDSEQLEDDQEYADRSSRRHAERSPPPRYPASESEFSSAASSPPRSPPPFSSLYASVTAATAAQPTPGNDDPKCAASAVVGSRSPKGGEASAAAPAYTSNPDQEAFNLTGDSSLSTERAFAADPVAETKNALPTDTKGGEPSGSKSADDAEPPPAYSEQEDSPLASFSYVMAAAGGAASIITQVQQGAPPVNALGDVGADETIAMDLRGTRFVLSRDELLTLPEFVLLSLFPNGLFPEGHMSGVSDGDAVQVDYDPASLQYMLDFFRNVAQTIPTETSPGASQDGESAHTDALGRGEDSKRAGIIVLREDLDFYAIPPRRDIDAKEMIEVKRAAARALQGQDGIFSGLKRSDEPGTTEAHLIEMLTAGGFNHDDSWGHRAGEPNKAVICSLALARLRSDIRGTDIGNAVGMAQKLLLFWRKPARRCWWEGVELDNVEGVEGKLKVWIRRVWTLEMSVIGLR